MKKGLAVALLIAMAMVFGNGVCKADYPPSSVEEILWNRQSRLAFPAVRDSLLDRLTYIATLIDTQTDSIHNLHTTVEAINENFNAMCVLHPELDDNQLAVNQVTGVSLGDGAVDTVSLLSVASGAGIVRDITVILSDTTNRAKESIEIFIRNTNGDTVSAVRMNIRDFFLGYFSPVSFDTEFLTRLKVTSQTTGVTMIRRINIPFVNGIDINLITQDGDGKSIWANVAYNDWGAVEPDFGIYAVFRVDTVYGTWSDPDLDADIQLFDVNDSLSGCVYALQMSMDLENGTPLEKNIVFKYSDTDSVEYSSTEDYYQNGFYYKSGYTQNKTVGTVYIDHSGYKYSCYRVHPYVTPIRFSSGIEVRWGAYTPIFAGGVLDATLWYYTSS